LLIRAPRQVYHLVDETTGRVWGVFIPLYSLRSGNSWGAGNFTDLGNLMRWVQGMGGSLVGTLPLLATFLQEPFDPSPYAPASRLFWNEFYLDVTRIPELERCPAARSLARSTDFQKEIASLRAAPLVDYRHGMAVRRSVIEELARCCFAEDSERLATLRRWVSSNPAAADYARFRAVTDRRGEGWPVWPDRMRDGLLREGDYDPEAERYHLYAQWAVEEQLQALAAETRQNGPGMYLDFPLGVHGAGYDVWREREAFVMSASTGAPPDALFEDGQDWGFPPPHPERIREQGYGYYIACLRHHLRHAGVLRLDHVMGLHHLFWIPPGLSAREGIYVRYRSAEFYAVLALESHRYKSAIVGEDLGTVPPYVRADMSRHGLHRMYVLPFEIDTESAALRPVPAGAAASLNTHDMPPFAASLGAPEEGNHAVLSDFLRREGLLEAGADDTASLTGACLSYLAASEAPLVLVNLEDLWQETAPQNLPGTGVDAPNWRRKARYGLEEFTRMPEVDKTLRRINELRGPEKAGG
jgi:4-alpha-glucanotransferase